MFRMYDPETLKSVQKAEAGILKDFDRVCEKYGIHYFLDGGTLLGAVRHQGFIPWDDDLDVGMTRENYERFKQIMPQELGADYVLTTPATHEGYCSAVIKLMKKGTKFVPQFSVEMKCWLGIYIDIFVWDNLSDKKVKAWLQMKEARILSQLLFLCGSSKPEIPYHGAKKLIAQGICKSLHFLLSRIPGSERRLYRRFEKISQQENNKTTQYITSFQVVDIYNHSFKESDSVPYGKMKFEDFRVSVPNNWEAYLHRCYGDFMSLPPEEKRVNHCAEIIDLGGGGQICLQQLSVHDGKDIYEML